MNIGLHQSSSAITNGITAGKRFSKQMRPSFCQNFQTAPVHQARPSLSYEGSCICSRQVGSAIERKMSSGNTDTTVSDKLRLAWVDGLSTSASCSWHFQRKKSFMALSSKCWLANTFASGPLLTQCRTHLREQATLLELLDSGRDAVTTASAFELIWATFSTLQSFHSSLACVYIINTHLLPSMNES